MRRFLHLLEIISAIVAIAIAILWIADEAQLIESQLNIYEPVGIIFAAVFLILRAGLSQTNPDKADAPAPRDNRQKLIDQVRENWIDGVLNDALDDARIKIDIKPRPDQAGDAARYIEYDLPIETVLRRDDQRQRIPLNNTPDVLLQTFDDVGRRLLILGAPGSGKTVLLLQLAEKLLDRAASDAKKQAVPVVVNLSSWALDRKPLDAWLVDELRRSYGVSKKLAEEWIGGDALIYLLDGLDEVAAEYRDECLSAINAFIGAANTRQVVVCSRIEEYDALRDKLKVRTAVELQPLPAAEVQRLLHAHIPNAETASAAFQMLRADDAVWEQANKPLFINVLMTTYADGRSFAAQNVAGDPLQQIQIGVIEPYLTRQLQNQTSQYSNADTDRYLAWIASNLRQREQTVFYVEMLQVDWHPRVQSRKRFPWLVRLLFGLFYGLVVGLLFGLVGGLVVGLVVGLLEIDLQQRISLDNSKVVGGLVYGLGGGLIGGLVYGLGVGLVYGLVYGLGVGLGVGLGLGLLFGLIGSSIVGQRHYINQGLHDTLRLGLLFGLVGGLGVGLVGGLLFGLFLGLGVGLVVGLLFGLFVGLGVGLGDVLKHLILRFFLHRDGLAPRRYDRFLEHVIERRIMRRVGGSAIFIHRYILEYYADEWARKYAAQYETRR